MKERLIKLIEYIDSTEHFPFDTDKPYKEALEKLYSDIAEYLLDNGVIVPPCKVGDTVWYIEEMKSYVPSYHTWYECLSFRIGYIEIAEKWLAFGRKGSGMFADIRFYSKDIGKTVFLTEEEAEAKLAELGGKT